MKGCGTEGSIKGRGTEGSIKGRGTKGTHTHPGEEAVLFKHFEAGERSRV